MTITIENAVTLDQFLEVAKEKGAQQEYINRVPKYLEHDYVLQAIENIAEFSNKPVEEVASRQLSHYLDLANEDMPPLSLSLS